jgi:hypothetical protein
MLTQPQVTKDAKGIHVFIPFKDGDEKQAPLNTKTNRSRTVAQTAGGFVQVPGAPDGVRVQVNCIAKV